MADLYNFFIKVFRQLENGFIQNSINQFDLGGQTIEADFYLFPGINFRIEKLRVTEGKFDKGRVQEVNYI